MFRFSRMPEGSQIFFLDYFVIISYFLLIRSFFVVAGFHLSGEVIPGRSTQTTVEQEVKFKVSVSFDRSAGLKRPSNNLDSKLSLPTNILAIMLSPRQILALFKLPLSTILWPFQNFLAR
jgi:hypothetical protein